MSELRQGRFKKMLVSPEVLAVEGPLMAQRLAPLFELFERGDLRPVELVALWSLQYLRQRHPGSWWGARRSTPLTTHDLTLDLRELPWDWGPDERKRLELAPTLGELWATRAFKATPEAVNRAILCWSEEKYPLVLMERIPSVEEVLEQQVRGQRCVTIFRQASQLAKLVLGERDPLGFTFHDLIHADHFFHDNELARGQIGFYRQMKDLLVRGELAPFMARAEFPEDLEYLLADMNSHPVHLWKCFKAICKMADFRAMERLFQDRLPGLYPLSPLVQTALNELNGQSFDEGQALALMRWCESF